MNSSLVNALLQAEPTEANLRLIANAIRLAPPSDGRRALERRLSSETERRDLRKKFAEYD